MSTLSDLFSNIGTAIRRVTGESTKLRPTQFANAINKMAYIDNGKVTGKVNSTEVATPTVSFNVDNGYFTVTQNQSAGLVAQDIKKAGYQLPTLSGSAVTPSNQDQIAVRKGNYIGGDITVKGDANLKSEYILRGRRINGEETLISIFGVQGTLERLRNLPKYHDEEIYGQLASDCAKSYHIARCVLGVEFKYSQSHGIFGDGVLTDSEGRCYMDCSTLGGLVARNIPFNKSPYAKAYGKANVTLASLGLDKTCVSSLNNTDPYLDMQTHEDFKFSFKTGYKSIRTASELAEYYYQQGRTLHVYEPGNPPSSLPSDVRAGDMLFWAKATANDHQKSRFMGISHVGIFANDPTVYFQVTGSDDAVGNTIFASNFADHMDEVVLIVRPDYSPKKYVTPSGVNLLPQYAFDSLQVSVTKTVNGLTFKPQASGGFTVQVTDTSARTDQTTFYLYGKERPITLTPGTYKLSGTPTHPQVNSTGTSLLWGLSVKKADGTNIPNTEGSDHVWDRGAGDTFTVTSTIQVYVYFFVSKSLTNTSKYSVKPSLIKQ